MATVQSSLDSTIVSITSTVYSTSTDKNTVAEKTVAEKETIQFQSSEAHQFVTKYNGQYIPFNDTNQTISASDTTIMTTEIPSSQYLTTLPTSTDLSTYLTTIPHGKKTFILLLLSNTPAQ